MCHNPAIQLLGMTQEKLKHISIPRPTYKCTEQIYNNQNLETSQQVNGKQIVAHPYNETQLSNKNE